jgi:DMSO/TMAO reductase YedYZ molybdopterin-dependent catalytic subunit
LTIDGLVERPRTLRFGDLVGYSKTELVSVHECCGSPFAPCEPTRRVSNVTWGGTRLADILADCRHGLLQPVSGRRNAVHQVEVDVR